jgi:hypothetical protein
MWNSSTTAEDHTVVLLDNRRAGRTGAPFLREAGNDPVKVGRRERDGKRAPEVE